MATTMATGTATDAEVEAERRTLAAAIVTQWYADFLGLDQEPKYAEVRQATDLVVREGEADVLAAYPIMIGLMRERFPTAVTWGGASTYWHLALQVIRDRRRKAEANQQAVAERAKPDPERAKEAKLVAEWGAAWDRLPADERAAIESAVAAANPGVRTFPAYFKQKCIREFVGRKSP